MSISDLVILTGASRGLGRAMADRLLAPGRLLVCISRGRDEALDARAGRDGAALEQWQLDLADPPTAASRLAARLGELSPQGLRRAVLINNAGTVGRTAPLAQAEVEDLSRALRVGLEAPMLLSAAFLRSTRDWAGTDRRILNISSGLGRHAMASQAPYCASKAGMDHFSRAVALEEAAFGSGARIVSLAPGVIDTDMQAQLRGGDEALFPDRSRFEKLKAAGQLTSPEDCAQAVLAWLDRDDFGAEVVADVRQP